MDLQPSQTEVQSHLLRVPTEVLLHISSYLSTPDYGRFRTVCRRIEESLSQAFAREYFTKRQFMFTEFSLQALVDISKSKFGSNMTYLMISVERPRLFGFSHLGANFNNQDPEQALKRNKFCEECTSHQTLISSGQDVEFLTEALRNLPRLRTIGLRDFNSRGRNRDGDNSDWSTYGVPTFLKETNSYPDRPRFHQGSSSMSQERDISYISHVFSAILRALGKAKEVHQAPGLEVILRGCSLPPQALNIPQYLMPTVSPVLRDLKVLFLDLGQVIPQSLAINNQGRFEGFTYTGYMLAKFLSMTPSLKHLRFGFRNCSPDEAKGILQWFSQVPITSGLPLNTPQNLDSMQERFPKLLAPEFPHLEKLEFGFVTIELPLLLSVLKRYKSTLRVISLHKVTLANPPHQASCKVNLWSKLFGQFTRLGLKLDGIRLSRVRQKYNADPLAVEFKCQNHGKSSCKEWYGFDLERASQEFIDSMVIDWPEDDEMEDDEISSEGTVSPLQSPLSLTPLLIIYTEEFVSEDEMDSDLDAGDDDDDEDDDVTS
ncbi:hypothetical protein F5B19DRAFT_265055 [Rostrohypoxylon terebratum]|nr:hypothetical protein F5B19DRAFT_265055 [Rostrohypoxylon terebratum]